MKKSILSLAAALLFALSASAIPANRRHMTVTQPDGTTLTVKLVGDEWNHCYRTTDGYTLVKDSRGYYTYARLNAVGQLMPSAQVAHDAAHRDASELSFLAGVQRDIMPAMMPTMQQRHDTEMQQRNEALAKTRAMSMARRAARDGRRNAPSYDYNNFRGLIILVEYSDLSFSRSDYADIFTDMVNAEGYTGYTGTNGRRQNYTGSVRDYFADNSNGMFVPQFDVVGPIKVSYSQYHPKASERAGEIFKQAVERADSLIDYSQYDGDNNGEVDMIFFMVPGYSSSYGGNDDRLLWPHASSLAYYNLGRKDGKKFGRYACSTEMYGWSQYAGNEQQAVIDGIGTICHEFSHVLGIMDHYDTDYEDNGQSFDPGDWDIMAGGSDGDRGRQPVGYNLYEKVAMGFTEPITVTQADTVTLGLLDEIHNGYRIPSGQSKETFYLENRQKTAKWGNYLPGHGLLVWRIDSTSIGQYYNNTLNANPTHNYVEIVRAKPKSNKQNSGYDTYPGQGHVYELTNYSSPANLLSWTKKECTFELEEISEQGGNVSFVIIDTRLPRPARAISLPQNITISVGAKYQLEPEVKPVKYTSALTWSSSNFTVANVDENGLVTAYSAGKCKIKVQTDNGLSATCNVTVENDVVCDSIAALLAMKDGDMVRLRLNNVEVTAVDNNTKDIYVRDSSGAIVMHGTEQPWYTGYILNGDLFCQRATAENGLPQLVFVEDRTSTENVTVTKDGSPQPIRISMDSLSQQYLGQLVELWGYQIETGVQITSAIKRPCLFQLQADSVTKTYLPVFNNLNIKNLKNDKMVKGHFYSVSGILWPKPADNTLGIEYELSFTTAIKDITDDPEWQAYLATLGINDITDNSASTVRSIYGPDGKRRTSMQRGLNLLRRQDGTVIKVISR